MPRPSRHWPVTTPRPTHFPPLDGPGLTGKPVKIGWLYWPGECGLGHVAQRPHPPRADQGEPVKRRQFRGAVAKCRHMPVHQQPPPPIGQAVGKYIMQTLERCRRRPVHALPHGSRKGESAKPRARKAGSYWKADNRLSSAQASVPTRTRSAGRSSATASLLTGCGALKRGPLGGARRVDVAWVTPRPRCAPGQALE